jgi:hypothetical protein
MMVKMCVLLPVTISDKIFNGLMNLVLNESGSLSHCRQLMVVAGFWNVPGFGHAMSECLRKLTPYVCD